MNRTYRVYVAGKLNADASGYTNNVHNMILEAEKIRLAGFAVFVPGLDFLQGVVIGNWKYEDYFANSQAWLDASDAMFLIPGWESSEGTKKEIERAKRKGIPVCKSVEELFELFEK